MAVLIRANQYNCVAKLSVPSVKVLQTSQNIVRSTRQDNKFTDITECSFLRGLCSSSDAAVTIVTCGVGSKGLISFFCNLKNDLAEHLEITASAMTYRFYKVWRKGWSNWFISIFH